MKLKSKLFKKPLPYLALLGAHLIWGINFVVAKLTLQEVPIMSLAFLRFTLSFLLIIPFLVVLKKHHLKISSQDITKLILVGFFMGTFNIAFLYEGLIRTSAINASALLMVIPVLSVLGGWWILKEKIYLVNLLGIVLGLAGALAVLGLPLIFVNRFTIDELLGNILIIFAAVSFIAGSILSKDLLTRYPAIIITTTIFLVSAVSFFLPATLDLVKDPTWPTKVTVLGGLGLLYITLLSSISAYFLLNWGMSKVKIYEANLFQYLEPAIAATFAVPLLSERISFSFIIGTSLVILGVYWGTLGKQEHHHHHHKSHRI